MPEGEFTVTQKQAKERSKFQIARETIWDTPGFQHRKSTIVSPGSSWQPEATYVVQVCRNSERWMIFLEMVDDQGGQRLVLPSKVVEAIFRQRDSIISQSKSQRAKSGAETKKRKAELTKKEENHGEM